MKWAAASLKVGRLFLFYWAADSSFLLLLGLYSFMSSFVAWVGLAQCAAPQRSLCDGPSRKHAKDISEMDGPIGTVEPNSNQIAALNHVFAKAYEDDKPAE
ncbi:hypothetical protein Droror1_Dr00027977, partial [Drosera rotundifolia]